MNVSIFYSSSFRMILCSSARFQSTKLRHLCRRIYSCERPVLSVANSKFERISCLSSEINSDAVVSVKRNLSNSSGTRQVNIETDTEKLFLKSFLHPPSVIQEGNNVNEIPYVDDIKALGQERKVFIQVHGCQMNVNDTEIVWSILLSHGFIKAKSVSDADVILLMTCSIRENAEEKIWTKLQQFRTIKNARKTASGVPLMIGVLGCMAERLKHKLVEKEKCVDVVAGPDSYRDLPRLLALTERSEASINVLLSLDETYADIMPVRLNQDAVTAFVSIMRGCDNMCSYCIVPFTRGRERSRPLKSIADEVRYLSDSGIKEVTLLGQNVNSYRDMSEIHHYGTLKSDEETRLAKGFRTVYKPKKGGLRFCDLLDEISLIDPQMRIRFTSPHPKDFPEEVLQLIAERNNICRSLHIPAQSGNTEVLQRMRRGYSREAYLNLIQLVREILPSVAISSDFICGFCGETEKEFEDTLTLMEEVKYNMAFLFAYSMRTKTHAYHKMKDDVPQAIKNERLKRMVSLFRHEAEKLNEMQIRNKQLVLVEGFSKRSKSDLAGRNDSNIKVIFKNADIPDDTDPSNLRSIKPGDYVVVDIESTTSQVLKGRPLYHTTLTDFYSAQTGERMVQST